MCPLALTVNGNSVNIGSTTAAAIDTGTTLIGGPSAAVKAFWGGVSGAVALTGNLTGFYAFRPYTSLLNPFPPFLFWSLA